MNQYIKCTQNTVYNSEALNKYSLTGSDVSVPQVRITPRTVLITSTDVQRPTPDVGGCGGAPSDSSSDFKRARQKADYKCLCSLGLPSCQHNFSEIRTSVSKPLSWTKNSPETLQVFNARLQLLKCPASTTQQSQVVSLLGVGQFLLLFQYKLT